MSKTLPVGLQVYSIRDDAERDFKGTMEKVKAMGYDGVELAGLYDLEPSYVRETLETLGLVPFSAHIPFAELIADPAGIVAQYVSIGCKYIVIPYLEESSRPGTSGYEKTLRDMRSVGEACKAQGAVMLYHNHDFEFITMPDGSFGLDHMYSAVPADLLQTELDTCWIKVAGQDPAAYVRKYANRCPVVHLKDFYKEGNPANMYELIGIETEKKESAGFFEFRPVGHGMQDFPPILEASAECGAEWVVVEQDSSNDRPPMEAVKMSRDYLKGLGW